MARRSFRKLAILAKIETTYGTDAAPTAAADAMLMTDATFTPLDGEEVARDLLLPWMGHQGVVLAGLYGRLQGSVELAGSGTAGTAPAYGPLLRACGLAQTLTAGVKAEYKPVSSGFEACSIRWHMDGTQHTLVGARGDVSLEISTKKIPKLTFDFMGLLGTVADAAWTAPTIAAFRTPLVASKVNTPTFSLHGTALVAEALSIKLGNKVEPRILIGAETIEISDRQATGDVTFELGSVADKDWQGIAVARTRGALAVVHGLTAGNIVQVDAPKVEIGKPTLSNSQGVLMAKMPMMLCPNVADDELVLAIR